MLIVNGEKSAANATMPTIMLFSRRENTEYGCSGIEDATRLRVGRSSPFLFC